MTDDEVLDENFEDEAPEYELDINKIKPQKHHWVDRGTHLSCESGDHPHHVAYKR